DPRIIVGETIAAPQTRRARQETVAELERLGLGRGLVSGDMSLLASQVQRTFPAPPMLGPPGTPGPRQDTPAPHRPAATGPTAPQQAGGPAAPRAAGGQPSPRPSLAAVFRRHGQRAAVHVFDRFATGHDRVVLAGLTGPG